MKIPLRYQMTDYDCGPTSLLNGISYLFEREEIPPEIVRNIMLFCLDNYGLDGTPGKKGTSHAAMQFLSHWLDQFGETGKLALKSEYLTGGDVTLEAGSRLRSGIVLGGTAVVRIDLEGWHYVLVTGIQADSVYVFDPYRLPEPFPVPGIRTFTDPDLPYNRIVPLAKFERTELLPYSFGPTEYREAVLMFNARTVIPEDEAVDYII
jgi:hypothetical protein